MWFSNDFSLFFCSVCIQRDVVVPQHLVYSTRKLALWQLGVSPGIVQGVLVAWGCHVHQQPRQIVVEATVCYMFGKYCFVIVVEDYDSGEIFVSVRNFE